MLYCYTTPTMCWYWLLLILNLKRGFFLASRLRHIHCADIQWYTIHTPTHAHIDPYSVILVVCVWCEWKGSNARTHIQYINTNEHRNKNACDLFLMHRHAHLNTRMDISYSHPARVVISISYLVCASSIYFIGFALCVCVCMWRRDRNVLVCVDVCLYFGRESEWVI